MRTPLFGWKTVLGCVLLAATAAIAVACVGRAQIHQLTHYLDENKSVKVKAGVLAADTGGAETILLVGNDTRSGQSAYRNYQGVVPNLANETLLVRLDPAKQYISMLSIPRELLTTIHCPAAIGTVQTRFNYALACGGFTTLVSTIKQITGLSVNHVVEIDFENFEKAVNELGCVYYQVDERYYHVNVPGGAQYQQVNLQPGYQKLCGSHAEQFVSFRHSDTSLIRDARDQTFLEAARQQYASSVLTRIGTFERIFGQLVQVDAGLKNASTIENLIKTIAGTSGYPIRQVQVGDIDYDPTDPAAVECNCTTAPASALRAAARSFLYGSFRPPTRHQSAVLARHRADSAQLGLAATTSTEESPALTMQTKLPLRVEFPRVQAALGQGLPLDDRNYLIRGPSGTAYPSFVEVFPVGLIGQYYDVEGTTWTDAPALSQATQSVSANGVRYDLTFTGAHLTQVAWLEHNAAYWVHNSLTDGLTNGQMLAIAEQTDPVSGPVPAARARLRLRPVAAPKPVAIVTSNGTSTAGEILGFAGLIILALVGAGFVTNRRRLRAMRRERDGLADRIVRLESLAARLQTPRTGARRR